VPSCNPATPRRRSDINERSGEGSVPCAAQRPCSPCFRRRILVERTVRSAWITAGLGSPQRSRSSGLWGDADAVSALPPRVLMTPNSPWYLGATSCCNTWPPSRDSSISATHVRWNVGFDERATPCGQLHQPELTPSAQNCHLRNQHRAIVTPDSATLSQLAR
jgi:hypothetical protein